MHPGSASQLFPVDADRPCGIVSATMKRILSNHHESAFEAKFIKTDEPPKFIMRCVSENTDGARSAHDFYYGPSDDGFSFALWRSPCGMPQAAEAVIWANEESSWRIPWLELLGEYWKAERSHGKGDCPVGWWYADDAGLAMKN